jgi:hypothetical protein
MPEIVDNGEGSKPGRGREVELSEKNEKMKVTIQYGRHFFLMLSRMLEGTTPLYSPIMLRETKKTILLFSCQAVSLLHYQ